jgi:hypothetical protein
MVNKPWHGVELEPHDALHDGVRKLITNLPYGLSPGTFKDYEGNLRRVRQQLDGERLITIISQGQNAISVLQNNARAGLVSANTLAADLGSVLACVKHCLDDKVRRLIDHYVKVWQAAHKEAQEAAQMAFNDNKAINKKQRNGFVSYGELCAVRDMLPTDHPLRLWLAMSTMIPCARAGDYANCKFFHEVPTSEELEEHKDNYVVLTRITQYVHLRVFKTSKSFPGGIKIGLPLCLCVEIMESLAHNHRDYLFVNKAGQPYVARKTFMNFLQRGLKNVLSNADANPQLVRRAYVTDLHARLKPTLQSSDPATAALAREQLAQLAHCCGHAVTTARKYAFDLDDGGSPQLLEVASVKPLPPAVAHMPVFINIE